MRIVVDTLKLRMSVVDSNLNMENKEQLRGPYGIGRDDLTRCKVCMELFIDADAPTDPISGALVCPKGCRPEFVQPPYESPLNT